MSEHSVKPARTRSGRTLRWAVGTAVLLALTALFVARAARSTARTRAALTAEAEAAARVERGRYLVTVAACTDCHTPFKMGDKGPEPDMERYLSGHPEDAVLPPLPGSPPEGALWMWAGTNTSFAGPWGVSFAMNLTPDENTGIGIWDEALFVQTLRTGKHWGTSREILPPMPWPMYSQMADEDLKSIYAYLRTIPPVTNHVPDAILAQ